MKYYGDALFCTFFFCKNGKISCDANNSSGNFFASKIYRRICTFLHVLIFGTYYKVIYMTETGKRLNIDIYEYIFSLLCLSARLLILERS